MKAKRFIAIFLCVLILLAIPFGSLATEPYDISITLNGDPVFLDAPVKRLYNNIETGLYVPMLSFCEMMGARVLKWNEASETALAVFDDFAIDATAGDTFITANRRCLYTKNEVKLIDGVLYAPASTIVSALDAEYRWDEEKLTLSITEGTGKIESGSNYYDDEDLFWLARIIYAEAGHEPMEGKIAVGNVVLNRVAYWGFPNTIYDVIFDRVGGIQFEPVLNGAIYNDPTEDCYTAAKLAMDGARPVEDCLFFASITDCWAARTRPFYGIIGKHYFYR